MTLSEKVSLATKVSRGAKLLDEKVPGWEKRIDVVALDLGNYGFCICGQLEIWDRPQVKSSILGLNKDGLTENGLMCSQHFTMSDEDKEYDDLTRLWRSEVERRRKKS